jgi:hypothetical protein
VHLLVNVVGCTNNARDEQQTENTRNRGCLATTLMFVTTKDQQPTQSAGIIEFPR